MRRLHRPRTHRARIRRRRLVPHRRHRDSRRRRLTTITDRKSDIIIRGGENISALEVEGDSADHAVGGRGGGGVRPDARLGEHVAAVLRLRPGCDMPTIDELQAHFAAAGLAKQKWPEELRRVDELPPYRERQGSEVHRPYDIAASHL